MKRFYRLDQINVRLIGEAALKRNKPGHEFTLDEIAAAYVRLSCSGTKFDNKTGTESDINGILCRYVNAADFIPYVNEDEIINDVFAVLVRNDAARYRNCKNAGKKY